MRVWNRLPLYFRCLLVVVLLWLCAVGVLMLISGCASQPKPARETYNLDLPTCSYAESKVKVRPK